MTFALKTIAALALTTTTALAMGNEGPAMVERPKAANKTVGESVTIEVTDHESPRLGYETDDGTREVTLFEGSEEIDTSPGGAHFR